MKEFVGCMARKEKSLTAEKNKKMTIGRLRSGHHPDLKYWLHKIQRAVDAISIKCGVGEEKTEHVVHD